MRFMQFTRFADDTKFVVPGYEHPALGPRRMRLGLRAGDTD